MADKEASIQGIIWIGYETSILAVIWQTERRPFTI